MSKKPVAPHEAPMDGMIRMGGIPSIRLYIRTAWGRREFAVNLASGELRSQNFDTVLGNVWHTLNPLLLVAVYYLMFGLILNISGSIPNFIGFLSVGIFTFSVLQRSASSGAGAIVGNLGLIRSLQFPRILLPVSAVLKEAMAFVSTIIVMVVVVVITELQTCAGADAPQVCSTFSFPISVRWLYVVPLLGLMLLFGFGIAFMTARLTDHVRDIANVLPYMFRILFYVSGVLYPVDRFVKSEWMRSVFNANPFYDFTTLMRHYLMPTYVAEDVAILWAWAAGWSFGMFTVGLLYFRARENRYGRG